MNTQSYTRRGTILIIVAGISALLASLALAFLARMKSDLEESQALVQYAQTKIMLAAACNYVQETSRLGWSDKGTSLFSGGSIDVDGATIRQEAFGWIDVRDGSLGPLNRDRKQVAGSNANYAPSGTNFWPNLKSHVRCPMHRIEMPPYAISQHTGYNLMQRTDESKDDFCYPLLRNPDPVSAISYLKSPTTFADFERGVRTPVIPSMGKAWFRLYRDGPATFVVTCGAGSTQGFKNWAEVVAEGQEDAFGGSQSKPYFDAMVSAEVRLWYRLEWTAAAMETSYHNLHHEIAVDYEHYETWPPNASHTWSSSRRTQTWAKNPVGTIRWVQRLMHEPTQW
jgi:hypothetical protein